MTATIEDTEVDFDFDAVPRTLEPFPPRPRRPTNVLATIHRLNRFGEIDFAYRRWIANEVTLGWVQFTADLTEEEAETLYRARDQAMRIDRLGRVTYDEPTLLRAVCSVVGD